MTDTTTPKLDSFRILVQQADDLQTDLSTIDAAVGERDAIKDQMSRCSDESEARKLLRNLARAEEDVTVKRIRQPRLQAELADLVTVAEKACNAAQSEAARLLSATPRDAVSAFLELVQTALSESERPRRRHATEQTIQGLHPLVLAEHQQSNLSSARRAVALPTEPLAPRLDGLKSSLAMLDKAHGALIQIIGESSRLAAACAAFQKAYANG